MKKTYITKYLRSNKGKINELDMVFKDDTLATVVFVYDGGKEFELEFTSNMSASYPKRRVKKAVLYLCEKHIDHDRLKVGDKICKSDDINVITITKQNYLDFLKSRNNYSEKYYKIVGRLNSHTIENETTLKIKEYTS